MVDHHAMAREFALDSDSAHAPARSLPHCRWLPCLHASQQGESFNTLTGALRALCVGVEQKQLSIAIAGLDQKSLDIFLADPTVFENYVDEVACPMYLNLITQRLDAGYYRSVAHIRHDIGLLLHNFKLFNIGEPFDWVEELQEMLLECVESELQPRPKKHAGVAERTLCLRPLSARWFHLQVYLTMHRRVENEAIDRIDERCS